MVYLRQNPTETHLADAKLSGCSSFQKFSLLNLSKKVIEDVDFLQNIGARKKFKTSQVTFLDLEHLISLLTAD